ncbi:MAG: thiolase family protein [Acidimicrobiia bacterium]|nr:thiolase family protein [Acidimicrobiia bacterium]
MPAVLLSAVRTPIGVARKGAFVGLSVFDLALPVVAEALKRSGVDPDDVDDVVLGEVMEGGGNIARHTAIALGLPLDTPGMAVQRACASGLSAVNTAAAEILAGMERVVIAGGAASMSQTPGTTKYGEPWISPTHPDTPDAPNLNMGITVGENTAEEAGVTRGEADHWSYHSHLRAVAATDDGRFAEEILPLAVGDVLVEHDEKPRRDTTLEKLASLPTVFKENGTVTAGNSSSLNDGACAVVVADAGYAAANGLTPIATIRAWANAGVAPRRTGLAPTVAIPRALERAGLTLADVDLVEINEAFASMAVGSSRLLGFDHEMVNVNGGAVGLGHPVACSGARILTTLVHELRRRGGGIGVAALCAGGGMSTATVVEV